ncbi:hypothetical protein DL98DRAFT_405734 [Cadophora sp. DSE1049]|nr:hypothetical protein DL98DRAFT_405734 [Cadophora sp. DSE1049]
MPSMRRIKVFGLLLVMAIITLLFYTSSSSSSKYDLESSQTGDFFYKTKSALERTPVGGGASTAGKGKVVGTGSEEDDKEASRARLKEAAQIAKDNANLKAPKPDPPSKVVGIGSAAEGAEKSVAGRKKFSAGGSEAQVPVKEEEKESQEEEVKAEFNSILKKAPIIIFSKSYCPHSARAKGILLEKYLIDPKPFVVELDQHPLGAQLQAKLADLTGRKTVPNVLINGLTIGGGDDVAELDSSRKLVDKVRDLGGKRMLEVRLRPIEEVKESVKEKVEEEKDEPHGLR